MANSKPERFSRPPKNPAEGMRWFWDFQAKDPRYWMGAAERLKTAADRLALFDHESEESLEPNARDLYWLQPVASMLVGMSIENMLKASLIADGETVIEHGKLVRSLGHHRLNEYADRLDFQCSSGDKFMLGELTRLIEWQGRYPVPKDDNEYTILIKGAERQKREEQLWRRLWEYATPKAEAWDSRAAPSEARPDEQTDE